MESVKGFSAVTDNTVRRQQYLARHGYVTITHHAEPDGWFWSADWIDPDTSRQHNEEDPELGSLLDTLDALNLAEDEDNA